MRLCTPAFCTRNCSCRSVLRRCCSFAVSVASLSFVSRCSFSSSRRFRISSPVGPFDEDVSLPLSQLSIAYVVADGERWHACGFMLKWQENARGASGRLLTSPLVSFSSIPLGATAGFSGEVVTTAAMPLVDFRTSGSLPSVSGVAIRNGLVKLLCLRLLGHKAFNPSNQVSACSVDGVANAREPFSATTFQSMFDSMECTVYLHFLPRNRF